MGILLTEEEIEQRLGKFIDAHLDYQWDSTMAFGDMSKAQLKKVAEWGIAERQRLKEKRVKQKISKPNDLTTQIIIGAKMKVLQQVIDKCGGTRC